MCRNQVIFKRYQIMEGFPAYFAVDIGFGGDFDFRGFHHGGVDQGIPGGTALRDWGFLVREWGGELWRAGDGRGGMDAESDVLTTTDTEFWWVVQTIT